MRILNKVMSFFKLRSLDAGKEIERDVRSHEEYVSLKHHIDDLERRAVAADLRLAEFEASMDVFK